MPAVSASPTPFQGLWIPLVTPFHDGAVDHPSLARMTKKLAGQGIAGFVACGSTGEAAALDKAEQLAVLETVLDASQGLPVVMGLSGYHLGQTQEWVQTLAQYPLAGLLVPAPHYIRAIKDCGGNAAKTQVLIADGRLAVLAGEDAQMFTTLALGGHGAIAASAHWQAPRFVALVELLRAGDLSEARRVWQALLPWVEACFAEANPAPLKAVLAHAGWMRNELRAPMTAAYAAVEQRLQALPGLSPR